MNLILVGRIFSVLACILMVIIGYLKHKRTILWAQNVQFILFSISYACLGGMAAVVSNIVSLVRNLICIKWNLTLHLQLLFIAFQGVFTFVTTDNRWIDWLPFLAATFITLSIRSKKDIIIKLGCIGSILCFGTYDFFLRNWIVFAFDCFSLVTSLIGVYRILRTTDESPL
ncbi:MAG: YgjV family protein [Pseudobutyrivibrio ruminis]|nr:YgjV family protein [Pseudobutyrivibrio ruminis]